MKNRINRYETEQNDTAAREPVIVIPAYRPDGRLTELVKELSDSSELHIVVVDDGSDTIHAGIFNKLKYLYDCTICVHGKNRGKGAAIKTGIREAKRLWPDAAGIVTADADGQHSPADILRVTRALKSEPNALILGARDFSGADVPFKSRWGNRITSAAFETATGTRCTDTQTGLRGIPRVFAETCMKIPGEHFEYEFKMLLRTAKDGIPLREVPIQTIYIEENKSSHFRVIRDSVSIYANFLKFGASSLCSALVDLGIFTLLTLLVFGDASAAGILFATVSARLMSGAFNFLLNKRYVFNNKNGNAGYVFKYAALFFGQMTASWLLVTALANVLPQLTVAKLIVDTCLFILSYFIQKNVVFKMPQGTKCIRRFSSEIRAGKRAVSYHIKKSAGRSVFHDGKAETILR